MFGFDQPPETPPPATAGELADRLVEVVVRKLEELSATVLPGLEIPHTFAGHRVDAATTGDLMYTLGLLEEMGLTEVAGLDIRSHNARLVRTLVADEVTAFGSYRVGETLLRHGGPDGSGWDAGDVAHAIACADSSVMFPMARNGDLPNNFWIVLARCLTASAALGAEAPELEEFQAQAGALFTGTTTGWINDGMGMSAQYDIYSPDMYLFAEPLADHLGDAWSTGFRRLFQDLEDLVQPAGPVVWGRSVGALSLAMTIELAAVAAARGLADHPGRWLCRASETLRTLQDWFPNGLIAAHQHRSTMFYRGPDRRLQMTFDILGKLVIAATELNNVRDVAVGDAGDAWPNVDRLIDLDGEGRAVVWAYRTPRLTFALPLIQGWSTDYAASLRSPGTFDVPTSGHPCMVPTVHVGTKPFVPADLPDAVEHQPGRVDVTFSEWAPVGSLHGSDDARSGTRQVQISVQDATVQFREELSFDQPPASPVSVLVPEVASRSLVLEADAQGADFVAIDTAGVAEWRSFWNEIPTVNQLVVPAEETVAFGWSMEPKLRVGHTMRGHWYDEALYTSIESELTLSSPPLPSKHLAQDLRDLDVLHMAWPEWWSGVSPEWTAQVLDMIAAAGTRIVWTQHNLLPHLFKDEGARASYQLWAAAADTVIHHSEWGRDEALGTYDYGASTRHEVIAHGHWGHRYAPYANTTRAEVEEREGWAPCGIRLAVVGAPRSEKDLQSVVDAVAACSRDDLQLIIRTEDEAVVPDDPRIVAESGHLNDQRYHSRFFGIDALVLPFAAHGMLTTGTAFDAIGSGTAVITSDWAFFDETFDGGDIRYGSTTEDLVRCLDGLDARELQRSAHAMVDLQSRFDWATIAQQTLSVLFSTGRAR